VTRAFRLATAATVALVVGSLLLRFANPFAAPAPDPSDVVPHLWGIASLVVVALAQSWAPSLAWVALVVGSCASALGATGLVREIRAASDGAEPPLLLGVLALAAVLVPPAVAAAYATHDGGRSRAVVLFAWVSVTALSLALALVLLARAFSGERGGVPEWAWLAVIGSLLVIGLVRDLRPPFTRTRERVAAGEAGPSRSGGALSVVRIFVDELVPGREAGRAEAAEDERGRLAADLHAEVLPSLRRALAEAEAGGTVERLAADLRTAVDEVESLLVARRSIVLEELGLLAAIEWLAERIEDRSDVRVEIEVAGDGAGGGSSSSGSGPGSPASGGAARPPREVERAAFRVAQLALDNVIRHAPGSTARVAVSVAPTAVRLRIQDDGDGPPVDEAAALRGGRRGIADMRAEARACGASLTVGTGQEGRGTAVELRWPA
jgi:signal transduction histidine kinase